MKDKRDCTIVQDLLPDYIENLLSEETNKYIEEHIKECEECQKTLEDMKKEIKTNKKQIDEKEVNYMKKFNKKMKRLKLTILCIVLLIPIIFAIVIGRRMIIISSLSNKAKKYVDADNFHYVSYSYGTDGHLGKIEYFIIGNKIKSIVKNIRDDRMDENISIGTKEYDECLNKEAEIHSAYSVKYYFEENNEKFVITDTNLGGGFKPVNILYTENFLDLFKCAMNTTIKEKTFKGKKCYYIEELKTNAIQTPQKNIYIDKETGLKVYTNIPEEYVYEETYEFNTVTEDDVKEPDISEYKAITNKEYITHEY